VLGEKERVPADTAAEIERGTGAARLQLRQQRDEFGLGIRPVGAAPGRSPTVCPRPRSRSRTPPPSPSSRMALVALTLPRRRCQPDAFADVANQVKGFRSDLHNDGLTSGPIFQNSTRPAPSAGLNWTRLRFSPEEQSDNPMTVQNGPCPFAVGEHVIYRPSSRGLDLDVMSSGKEYKIKATQRASILVEGYDHPSGGIYWTEFQSRNR
jgi:hypothetical protein